MTHRKLLIVFLLCLGIGLESQGQEKSALTNENVFCYLVPKTEKTKKRNPYRPLTLLIDNQSKDSIPIEDFSKYIYHKSTRPQNIKTFSWEFLTTSGQTPDDIVIVTGGVQRIPNRHTFSENTEIVISPNSVWTSDIYIVHSHIYYPSGYYKLCLRSEKDNKCIAEIVFRHELK